MEKDPHNVGLVYKKMLKKDKEGLKHWKKMYPWAERCICEYVYAKGKTF